MSKVKMDLTPLFEGRVHLHGFDCAALRALRTLQAVLQPPNEARIEFWEVSNTNPAKVACVDCWRENPSVHATFTPYVVIKMNTRFPHA